MKTRVIQHSHDSRRGPVAASVLVSFLLVLMLTTGCSFSRFSREELKEFKAMSIKKKAEKALFYMNKRKYKQAIAIYELIIKTEGVTEKNAAWARYEIGFCYRVMGKYKLALKNFGLVISVYQKEESKPARLLARTQITKLKAGKFDGF